MGGSLKKKEQGGSTEWAALVPAIFIHKTISSLMAETDSYSFLFIFYLQGIA